MVGVGANRQSSPAFIVAPRMPRAGESVIPVAGIGSMAVALVAVIGSVAVAFVAVIVSVAVAFVAVMMRFVG
jgi:hypothetical protein